MYLLKQMLCKILKPYFVRVTTRDSPDEGEDLTDIGDPSGSQLKRAAELPKLDQSLVDVDVTFRMGKFSFRVHFQIVAVHW